MDFITGLPKVNGKGLIFVAVDILTKCSFYAYTFRIQSTTNDWLVFGATFQIAWSAIEDWK